MNTVIRGCKTIEEFKETQKKMLELVDRAYSSHKSSMEHWQDGEPVKAWFEDGCDICVEYESGNWWHYKDLEMNSDRLPFPRWW